DDAAEAAKITVRPTTPESFRERMRDARCLGIFHGGRLAGYTWAGTRAAPVPGSGRDLLLLGHGESYLFDIYIAPEHRGARLAPVLRAHLLQHLAGMGRGRCYSL